MNLCLIPTQISLEDLFLSDASAKQLNVPKASYKLG